MVTPATGEKIASKEPQVTIKTSVGKPALELYPDKASNTVDNFLAYVKYTRMKYCARHRHAAPNRSICISPAP